MLWTDLDAKLLRLSCPLLIGAMAQCNDVLMFSEEDLNQITSDMPTVVGEDRGDLDINWGQLQFLKKECIRMFLHALALADYCRECKIPQGLRINKPPACSGMMMISGENGWLY